MRLIARLASGTVTMTRTSQKPGIALATHSPHNRTMPTVSSAFCAPRPRLSLLGDGASVPWSGGTGRRQTDSSPMARRPRPST